MSRLHAWLASGLIVAALPALPVAANILAQDSVPRVEDPLCPGVMGMQVGPALQILDRIRDNARRLNIRLADPDSCSPNLLVAFVDDSRESVVKLMHSQPQLFETLSMPQRRELLASNGAVRAWNVVTTRTRDGMWVGHREDLVDIPQARMWNAHSKIYTPTRQDIISTIVLFDNQSSSGLTTKQLADYATMRSLASDFTAYHDRKNSILSLFDNGAGRSKELSESDVAFLRDVYSGIANLPHTSKERTIEHQLEEQEAG